MFRTGSKCSGDLPPSRVSLSPATSSLSIGDKVIVLVGGRGHAGRSWRPSAPSPQVGGGVVAVLNAPLLGHNPSQWRACETPDCWSPDLLGFSSIRCYFNTPLSNNNAGSSTRISTFVSLSRAYSCQPSPL